MIPFYLDIETIPGQNPVIRDAIAAALKPPASMSKAETIAKWEAEAKPGLIDESWRKTSFDGALGEIILIGFARGDDGIQVAERPKMQDERGLLVEAFELMDAVLHENEYAMVQVVGHNVADFDLRFIWQRAVIHGVKPPPWLPFRARPWDDAVFDTMTRWAGANKFVSLDKLCTALGIARKGTEIGEEIDGSKVWEFWQAGRYEELVTYCAADVSRVREAHARMTFLPTMFST